MSPGPGLIHRIGFGWRAGLSQIFACRDQLARELLLVLEVLK